MSLRAFQSCNVTQKSEDWQPSSPNLITESKSEHTTIGMLILLEHFTSTYNTLHTILPLPTEIYNINGHHYE